MAGIFSGIVGKPDVIIDDDPSSVFPERTILWRGDSQWQNLIPTMFTEFSPSNELIAVVDEIIKTTVREDVDTNISELYDEEFPNRNPIPFFGDLENAEILTLAVNPSPTEFHEDRCWKPTMEANELSFRLVNYFRLWNPPSHGWFTPLETKLRLQGCSYLSNSAHIDLSPRATRVMSDFEDQPEKFREMVRKDATRWIIPLLNLAKRVKEIRLCRTMLSATPRRKVLIGRYIEDELPREIWQRILQFNPKII